MTTNIGKVFTDFERIESEDKRSRFYLPPARIIKTYGNIENAELLTSRAEYQGAISPSAGVAPCVMKNNGNGENAAILIDYGREIHGCIRISVWTAHKNGDSTNIPFKARIRFGESITEAITPLYENNARNDHAIRDYVADIPFMSAHDTGETGFRYLYLEVLDKDIVVNLNSLTAVLIINDYPYLGSFESSDKRLNEIWKTAAYTVQLNIQQYFWDGIKRDRIVWHGDLNTEICTAYAVFGDIPEIRKSLDNGVETTPLPNWMNGIPSYSCWWLHNVCELYMHTGDSGYILKHKDYITGHTGHLLDLIDDNGFISDSINTFVDWSTAHNGELKSIAFAGVLGYTLKRLPCLLSVIGKEDMIYECDRKHKLIKDNAPTPCTQKIASALLMLGDLCDAEKTDRDIISIDGASGYSTFMGYSILNAKSLAGNFDGAIDAIKEYWGGMLDMGATTFWEDFDLEWTRNSTGIDEFPTTEKDDIHASFGKHCYIKLRHSLCHGWASGPCPWLTENVLGFRITEPGTKTIQIDPHLGSLTYARGSIPTPYGIVSVSHKKDENGNISTEYTAPAEITVITNPA